MIYQYIDHLQLKKVGQDINWSQQTDCKSFTFLIYHCMKFEVTFSYYMVGNTNTFFSYKDLSKRHDDPSILVLVHHQLNPKPQLNRQ